MTKRKYITVQRDFGRTDIIRQLQISSFCVFDEPGACIRSHVHDIREAGAYGCVPILGVNGACKECMGIHLDKNDHPKSVKILQTLIKDKERMLALRKQIMENDYSWSKTEELWTEHLL